MVIKGKIAHYREKLDKTLASHDLTDEKKLETLVKDQIVHSLEDTSKAYNEDVVAKRTAEVCNFLGMLRSVSDNCDASSNITHHASWKLKQDTEEFRVMYREGPLGSPFHSLLVEGYIEAPIDVCLCVSLETELYPKWFPEILIPTFKIVSAKTLQKVGISEEISLVRVKLSWPLSSREAILHYFVFEYLEDDLVIVLMNTIPDVDNIQMETHGFTNEGIPEAGNTVRIELVGGFALQKVTENRSYFRTIANMDIKLDFVPPSLINFISRQLIGSGFRLYQKTTASVSKGDETFAKALNDPLYSRIRETLLSNSESKRKLGEQMIQDNKTTNGEEQKSDVQDGSRNEDLEVLRNDEVDESSEEYKPTSNEIEEEEMKKHKHIEHENNLGEMFKVEDHKILQNGHVNGYSPQYEPATEIEEEETEGSENVVPNGKVDISKHREEGQDFTDQLQLGDLSKKVRISPQVEQALGTLDKLITVVKEGKLKPVGGPHTGPEIEEDEAKKLTMEKHMKLVDKGGTSTNGVVKAAAHASNDSIVIDHLRSKESDCHTQEGKPDLTSPVQNPPTANWSRNSPTAGDSPVEVSPMNMEVNGIHENNLIENKKTGQPRKWRLCCLHLVSGRLVS